MGASVAVSQAVEACAFGQAAAALMVRACDGPECATKSRDRRWPSSKRWLAGAMRATLPSAGPGLARARPGAVARRGGMAAILLPFRALLAAIEAAR